MKNNYNGCDDVPIQSWVNFADKTPDAATRTGTSPYFTSFYEGFTSTPASSPVSTLDRWIGLLVIGVMTTRPKAAGFDNTLLGVLYIRHTTTNWNNPGDVLWSGTVTYAHNGIWVAIIGMFRRRCRLPFPSRQPSPS